MPLNTMEPKRLNKFISDAGFCSRREADRLIEEERVTVNGKLADAGAKVTATDKVRIDDQILRVREELPVFLIFNKPANMSAKADPSVRDNVVRAINHPASLQPIGHLDRDADGLLFLSNDSDLVSRMTKYDNKYEQEFLVTVNKLLTSEFLTKLSGSEDNASGEKTQKTFIAKEGSNRFRIILKASTNHNIKRMVEELGYRVEHLSRIRIEKFTLAKLPSGHWRALNPAEVESLASIATTARAKSRERNLEAKSSYTSRGASSGARVGKSRPTDAPSKERDGKSSPAAASSSRERVGKSKPAGTAAKSNTGGFSRSTPGPKGAPKGSGPAKSGARSSSKSPENKGGSRGGSAPKGPSKRGR
ncbi:pseudouridine synthase [Pontibacter akesuensis]|uniref:23S rRNA pseudouridine2604 synthase n=1 Tax=Pontibacter akesuensis TaxID=388950 RepID=A0A1I7GRP7_9BACT|nr:S4 domain-containing protein [Pontibacter akesuensis]GHA55433.1 pseudouridine synthase [Pontibacter akesuensis]SFU51108.1 23S rRNA pseudouridine2604 synthase [Pontibacter akesuensis]